MKNTVEEIRKFVSNNELDKAFEKLLELTKVHKSYSNSSLLLKQQFTGIKKDYKDGEYTHDKFNSRLQQLGKKILEFLNEIEEEFDAETGFQKLKNVLYEKIEYEEKCFATLRELESSENILQINTIKNLIKYEYRLSIDTGTNITLILKEGKELKLEKVISYGLNTTVIKAEDQNRDPWVLKVLQPQLYKSKKDEFKKRHKLQKECNENGYIAKIIGDEIEKDEIVFFKIRAYDQNLKDYVLKKFDSKDYYQNIEKIFSNVCAAIMYLHNEKKVAHRDIGPTNILLKKDKRAFLADFDNIYAEDAKEDMREKTVKKGGVYFDIFIAPEYISNLKISEPSYSFEKLKRYDLYSLCCTLLFCILKRRLNGIEIVEYLKPNNRNEVYAVDLLDHPDFKYKLNEDLRNFFEKGLCKNEKIRFDSIEELFTEFENIKNKLELTEFRLLINAYHKEKSHLLKKIENIRTHNFKTIFLLIITFFICLLFVIPSNIMQRKKIIQLTNWYSNKVEIFNREDENAVSNFFNKRLVELERTVFEENEFIAPNINGELKRKSSNETLKYADIISIKVDAVENNLLLCDADFGISVCYNFSTYHSIFDSIKTNTTKEDAVKIFGNISNRLVDKKNNVEGNDNNCFDLGTILDFEKNFTNKYRILMFWLYHNTSDSTKSGIFFRYPAPHLNQPSIEAYNPEERPWMKEISEIDSSYKLNSKIIFKNTRDTIIGVTGSYQDYKKMDFGHVRTAYQKILYKDGSSSIYGLDFVLIK